MFIFPISRRQTDRPHVRLPRARRPLVENLEGRRLLSGIQGNHIGVMSVAPAIVGQHIGTAAIQGNHIGTPAIVGQHIGTSVTQVVQRKHIGTDVAPAIVGNHIGTPAIVGQHIGTAAIQGNHIGTPAIVGQHIGMGVTQVVQRKHVGEDVVPAVQAPPAPGNFSMTVGIHLGRGVTPAIVGDDIGHNLM